MIASTLRTRRKWLGALGAGAAALMLPAPALACPVGPVLGRSRRVVVIGGGYGGATAAKYLRLWSGGLLEVVLIERQPRFVSCPVSNLVLAGARSLSDLTLPYDGLARHGVRVVQDEVTAIDANARRVVLRGSGTLSYDWLVIAPGVDLAFDAIPGLMQPGAQDAIPHAWKAGPQTLALRAQLEAMPDGGVFLLAIPKAPYRCPPGPYERACLVAHYFKTAKPRAKVVVLDANPDIVSKKALFGAAWKELYPGMIDYRPDHEVKDLHWRSRTVYTEFDACRGDVVNVLPPMRAGAVAINAGLASAGGRWCEVNWQTMESVAAPGIHVLGDATLAAPAMPKSASMANNHAKIAASAIVATLFEQPVNPLPTINNTCYSYVSDCEAMHVDSVHVWDPQQRTLLTVPGAGGTSPRRSEQEKHYADAWAKNIWLDTLG